MPRVLTTIPDKPRATRAARVALLLALLAASYAVARAGQQTPAPTRPAVPAQQTAAPEPRRPATTPDAPARRPRAATPPTPAPASAPPSLSASPQARAPQAPRGVVNAPRQPAAPREVVTVVHRLSGWKLLAMMAAARTPRLVAVDEFPFNQQVHTNIVAGYVTGDGRTVVAHLPPAAAEAASRSFPKEFFGEAAGKLSEDSELTVVRGDGRVFDAKFIGLDASTGLTFLEVAEPLVPVAATPPAPALAEGQRVHLFAPEPSEATPPSEAAPPVSPEVVGDTGVVYSLMNAVEGRLSEVRRAPTGRPIHATVRAGQMKREHAGAIAVNDAGALVGILTEPEAGGAAQLVTAESVRGARQRVLKRRASVPQPWLGVRGQAVAQLPLNNLLLRGWPRERAAELVNRRLGVLLSSVAPGTPAARAGLLPGDIVARVSEREVRGVEEFSFFLNEAGVGSTLDFTVLRAQRPDPLRMTVELSGARNPASATSEAEARAGAPASPLHPGEQPAPLVEGLETIGLSSRLATRLRAGGGLLVLDVRPDSPAASAGLRTGDIIETVNGRPAFTPDTPNPRPPESSLTLGVVRTGQKIVIKVGAERK